MIPGSLDVVVRAVPAEEPGIAPESASAADTPRSCPSAPPMSLTPPSPPAVTVLDPVALGRLRELDPTGQAGVVRRVLSTFDGSLSQILQNLELARGSDNVDEIRRLAHTLKSSSASVGALALSSACARVESLVRDQTLQPLPDALAALMLEGQAALLAVRRQLAS